MNWRRFHGIEWGVLALAGLFVLAGVFRVIYPDDAIIFHLGYDRSQSSFSSVEYVSGEGIQVYGILAIAFGVGLAGCVACKGVSKP